MRQRSLTAFLLIVALPAISFAQAQPLPRGAAAPPASMPVPPRGPEPAPPPPLPVREPNADLENVLGLVTARSGVEFLVSRDTPERIYVGGIDPNQITYPILLGVLRNNGLAGVEIEGRINVVPERNARSLVTQIVQRDDTGIPDDLWVTRIIEVRDRSSSPDGFSTAAMLVPVLRPLLPQTAHFAAYPDSSSLIIVDRYANVKRISAIVDELTR